GAGKAYEVLNDLGKAQAKYQQLVQEYPNTVLGQAADARLKVLNDPSAKSQMDAVTAAIIPAK
ncbi:MAG TPA: hypothetical protein VMS17_01635, partial [Gemmataceae bacterium]|nr:hypothetical protein [Gemmataceae bacterium]